MAVSTHTAKFPCWDPQILKKHSVCTTLRVKDFLYLDSAHLKGETLLEITEAYRLMRPGGVLLGDDLDWPAVESDLSEFLRAQKIRQWLGDDSEV